MKQRLQAIALKWQAITLMLKSPFYFVVITDGTNTNVAHSDMPLTSIVQTQQYLHILVDTHIKNTVTEHESSMAVEAAKNIIAGGL